MNQGEIAGYATEITDYIPAGLKFVQEDNPIWTKTDDGYKFLCSKCYFNMNSKTKSEDK